MKPSVRLPDPFPAGTGASPRKASPAPGEYQQRQIHQFNFSIERQIKISASACRMSGAARSRAELQRQYQQAAGQPDPITQSGVRSRQFVGGTIGRPMGLI